MSFDQYLESGCPADCDWNLEDRKFLSVRDIGDWDHTSSSDTEAAPRYVHPTRPNDEEGAYSGDEEGTLPSGQERTVKRIQASLAWTRRCWTGRFPERRTMLWRLVIAQSHGPPFDEAMFSMHIPPNFSPHILVPSSSSRWNIPLQHIHISPFAIPSTLADTPCSSLTPQELVAKLNSLLDAHRTMEPELEQWLAQRIEEKQDFGVVYGHLRIWWRSRHHFSAVTREMESRRDTWNNLDAFKWARQDTITDAWTYPPRRVWDLYSNRVLPFHILFSARHHKGFELLQNRNPMPSRVWAVSHCWVPDSERQSVWTNINGREWPVPIPMDTTLDHIRIELLNMGAEYVFLDVLCLRQPFVGHPALEELRQEEWKVDIPTLKNVYQRGYRPDDASVVVYFNGLGRPLDVSRRETLESKYHWFQRTWTAQEATRNWLPAGLTYPLPESPSGGPLFAELMHKSIDTIGQTHPEIMDLVYMFQDRPGFADMKEHDRVAALSYLSTVDRRPKYVAQQSADEAWLRFVDYLQYSRCMTDILLRHPGVSVADWMPSWEQIITTSERFPTPSLPNLSDNPSVSGRVYTKELSQFHYHPAWVQKSYILDGHYRVEAGNRRVIQVLPISNSPRALTLCLDIFAEISPDEDLTLQWAEDLECWIVGKNMGNVHLPPTPHGLVRDEEKYLLFKKLTVGRTRSPVDRARLRRLHLGRFRQIMYWSLKMEERLRSRGYLKPAGSR